MADDWVALDDLCRNGVGETGIAANIDQFSVHQDGLIVLPDKGQTLIDNTIGLSARIRQVVMAGIAYLIADARRIEPGKATFLRAEARIEAVPPGVKDSIQAAVLLMTAAKVNWYQTNHHTGQGAPSGYFLKCLKHLEIEDVNREDLHGLWKMAHWANTRTVLIASGVKGIGDPVPVRITADAPEWFGAGADKAWADPSRDVQIRANSFPSGTAVHALVVRACQAMVGSAYARVVPREAYDAYRNLVALAVEIHANGARFHVGSAYLTGMPQMVLPPVSPILQGAAHSFLTVVFKDSTLAKSPTVNRLEPNANLVAYFTQIRTATLRGSKKITEAIAYISGSAIGGDAFAEPDEYRRQLKDIEASKIPQVEDVGE